MALNHLLVLELASVLAGPTVGQFFSELGAKVIKFENQATDGDITRKWLLPKETDSPSAYYRAANLGKESILIDLKKAADKEVFYSWVAQADIVIMNYKPGDAEKLGVSYADLKKVKADIIVGEITGYGENTPRTGYDAIVQAESGLMYLNRNPEDKPLKMPIAFMDLMAAHQLKEGLLVALLRRFQTGKGDRVQVSLIQSGLASLANQGTAYICAQQEPEPLGSDHPSIVPYGTVFQTKDQKFILLAVGNDREFFNLCSALNLNELSENKSFKTNIERVQNKKYLLPILEKAIQLHERNALLNLLHEKKVPAAPVFSISEALTQPYAQPLIVQDKDGKGIGLKTVVFQSESHVL